MSVHRRKDGGWEGVAQETEKHAVWGMPWWHTWQILLALRHFLMEVIEYLDLMGVWTATCMISFHSAGHKWCGRREKEEREREGIGGWGGTEEEKKKWRGKLWERGKNERKRKNKQQKKGKREERGETIPESWLQKDFADCQPSHGRLRDFVVCWSSRSCSEAHL